MKTRPRKGEMKETWIQDQNYVKLAVDKHSAAQPLALHSPGAWGGKQGKWPKGCGVTRMQITPSYATKCPGPPQWRRSWAIHLGTEERITEPLDL